MRMLPRAGRASSPLTQLGENPEQSLAPAVPSVWLKRLRSLFALLENQNRHGPARLDRYRSGSR